MNPQAILVIDQNQKVMYYYALNRHKIQQF